MNEYWNDDSSGKEYLIDLSGVTTKEALHEAIGKSLPLPEYYGNNLDALFDVLSSLPEPCTILFANVSEAKEAIPHYIERLQRMCRDVQWENRGLQVLFSQR